MIDLKNDDLLINEEVNNNLENILTRKIFANGYIFYGPEGIGKKQRAIQFIKEIFNQNSSNAKIEEQIINLNTDLKLNVSIDDKFDIKKFNKNYSARAVSNKLNITQDS